MYVKAVIIYTVNYIFLTVVISVKAVQLAIF